LSSCFSWWPGNVPLRNTENSPPNWQNKIEALKIELEQARNNPFMQEKIDALTAENQDLQAELDALRHR